MNAERTYTDAQMRCIDRNRDINMHYDWWDSSYDMFIDQLAQFGIAVSTKSYTYDKKGPDGKFLRGTDGKGVKGVRHEPQLYFELHCQGAGVWFEADRFTLWDLLREGRRVMSLPDDDERGFFKTSDNPVLKVLRDNFLDLESKFGTATLSGELVGMMDQFHFIPQLNRQTMSMEMDWTGDEPDDYPADTKAFLQKMLDEFTEADTHNSCAFDLLTDLAHAFYKELDEECDYLCSDDAVWDSIEANDLFDEEDEEACEH